MLRSRVAVVCADAPSHWWEGDEPTCLNPTHRHQQIELHVHRDLVELPDSTTLIAASFDDADPYTRDWPPEFGVYFDQRWQPPWPHELVDWPDWGVPASKAELVTALHRLLIHARAGHQVEIGCWGGHGRTGTALACLAVLTGMPPEQAVAWTREHYCPAAVETHDQERFIASVTQSDGRSSG